MSVSLRPVRPEVDYPETDGEPMAENTLQFRWIVTIKEGIANLFRDDPDVFVAGDLFWSPVEGDPKTRTAPDVMVAFGRPRGDRRSYLQWREDHIPPQVVFEVLSPGNRPGAMGEKLRFYERFGVEEYYIHDPDENALEGWRREGDRLQPIPRMDGWTSPRLGIRFDLSGPELIIWRPDGQLFQSFEEVYRERDTERARADEAQARAQEAQARADEAQTRAERLAARLRELGLDPDA